ncbi:lysophospholipid acyltransferase family protein [Hansschlegelia sp. KR7-227]|uniref:lysophospholipid acyltransferase family protein n=1 Tax=Hansschlegelia sp. KR7-227 TaxID=3400914 RepID=UPI003BFDBD02
MPLTTRAFEARQPHDADGPPRAGRVVLWRSLLFNVLMALHVCLTALITGPFILVLPRRHVVAISQWWARGGLWLLKVVVGIEVEIRGRENLSPGGALIAAKHQSALETFAIVPQLDDPVFVLKRELTWVPLFGWFLSRLKMIAIDRSAGGGALLQMLDQANAAMRAGRQVVIFPEGTRRPVGAPPRYKLGVTHLYERLDVSCIPVAMDTGVFWPRRTLRRRQGRAVIQFLEPIPPGLDRASFEKLLRQRIETATDRLVAEARAHPEGAAARPGKICLP